MGDNSISIVSILQSVWHSLEPLQLATRVDDAGREGRGRHLFPSILSRQIGLANEMCCSPQLDRDIKKKGRVAKSVLKIS